MVIDFIANYAQIIIPEGVKAEAVDLGLQAGYSDALELERLIKAGAITVAKAQPADPPFETVVAASMLSQVMWRFCGCVGLLLTMITWSLMIVCFT